VSPLDWLPAAIRERSRIRYLAAGEALFRQGDTAAAIFAVEDGQLRLIRHAADSRPVILHTARAGELFAEAALFADAYHCDAVATWASRVRTYPKRQLLTALRGDAALSERFMAILARQIQALRARLEERNIQSARAGDASPGAGRGPGWPDGAPQGHDHGHGGGDRPHPRGALSHAGRLAKGRRHRPQTGRDRPAEKMSGA
jgi:CRP-like cAMP-binding protein